jgi:hypothetical protein
VIESGEQPRFAEAHQHRHVEEVHEAQDEDDDADLGAQVLDRFDDLVWASAKAQRQRDEARGRMAGWAV